MSTEAVIAGLSHPLRARILAVLEGREASPKEIADLLSEKLGNVSYHVRILRDAELIELVRTTPRRGAIEHHYRAALRHGGKVNAEFDLDDTGWAEVDAALDKLNSRFARIAKKNPGDLRGHVVGLAVQS